MRKPNSSDPEELRRVIEDYRPSLEVGSVIVFYGKLPQDYIPADGRRLLAAAMPGLFSLYGRTYSQPGDPADTFRVPTITTGGLPWVIKCR
jgi:hypothetical protein